MTHFPAFRTAVFFTLTFSVLLASCMREVLGIHGSGSAVNETRSLSAFTGVDLSCDADVVLHTDSVYRIEISGQQNVINVLSTYVRGGRLCIDFSRNVLSHSGLTIDVYAPYYSYAGISGSGNISGADGWSTTNLEATVSGTGMIYLSSVQAADVDASVSGTGTVRLDGTCQSLDGQISGTGDIHAFGMSGATGNIRVSGSGDVEVNVTQSLDVDIAGSGDVYYRNTPAVTVNISGTGQLIHVQ